MSHLFLLSLNTVCSHRWGSECRFTFTLRTASTALKLLHLMQKPPLNMELTLHPFLRQSAVSGLCWVAVHCWDCLHATFNSQNFVWWSSNWTFEPLLQVCLRLPVTTCMWFAPRSRRNNVRVIMSINGHTVITKAGSPLGPKLQLKAVRLQG